MKIVLTFFPSFDAVRKGSHGNERKGSWNIFDNENWREKRSFSFSLPYGFPFWFPFHERFVLGWYEFDGWPWTMYLMPSHVVNAHLPMTLISSLQAALFHLLCSDGLNEIMWQTFWYPTNYVRNNSILDSRANSCRCGRKEKISYLFVQGSSETTWWARLNMQSPALPLFQQARNKYLKIMNLY